MLPECTYSFMSGLTGYPNIFSKWDSNITASMVRVTNTYKCDHLLFFRMSEEIEIEDDIEGRCFSCSVVYDGTKKISQCSRCCHWFHLSYIPM